MFHSFMNFHQITLFVTFSVLVSTHCHGKIYTKFGLPRSNQSSDVTEN